MNAAYEQGHDLTREIQRWLYASPSWYLRDDELDDDNGFYSYECPVQRYATSSEIAAEIVNDPALRDALIFLGSPLGQYIEQAVARLYLPPITAQLLTSALTEAWKIVLDQNRPVWQRTEVLVGAAFAIAFIGIVVLGGRTNT